MRRTPIALTAVAFSLAATAAMGQVAESEPNNTPALADFLGTFNATGAVLAEGVITPGDVQMDLPGDVDLYGFTVSFEANLLVSLFGIPDSEEGDPQLALMDGAGVLAADDDSGPGLFPSLQFTLAPGSYFLAVTGFNDLSFPGPFTIPDGRNPNQTPHTESFTYKMLVGVSVIPAPGAAALLGLGALAAARRRR